MMGDRYRSGDRLLNALQSSAPPSRYDLLLTAIPLIYVLVLVSSQLSPLSAQQAVVLASVVSAGLIRNPPLSPEVQTGT